MVGRQWEAWRPGDDDAVARTPPDIKHMFGLLFGQLIPGSLQKYGPIFCYESINRHVRDGNITLEIRRTRNGALMCRWRSKPMGEFVIVH